jgi:hypothetical protein
LTVTEPSRADELLAQTLTQLLSLAEVRVLDHFRRRQPVIKCSVPALERVAERAEEMVMRVDD